MGEVKLGSPDPAAIDPDVYAPAKRFGPIVVALTTGDSFVDPAQDFRLDRREMTLRLQLLSPRRGLPKATLSDVTEALQTTAYFIETHGLNPVCLQGQTYERLGRVASQRFGFHMIEPSRGLFTWWAGFESRRIARRQIPHKNPGKSVVVYRETANFLQQYG